MKLYPLFCLLLTGSFLIHSCAASPERARAEELLQSFEMDCDGAKGRNGMVASTNEVATRAGVSILESGGNAMDAAAAVQFALSVVSPQSTGIAGGMFIMMYDAETEKVYGLDGREEAPSRFHDNIFCNTTSMGDENCLRRCVCESGEAWEFEERRTGGISVGVPGTVAAVTGLHGLIELEDMEGYKAVYREPISFMYNDDLRIYGMAPPTAGGVYFSQVVQILKMANVSDIESNTDINYITALINAQDTAWSDRNHWIGDADFVAVPINGLTNIGYIRQRVRDLMHDDKASGAPVPYGVPGEVYGAQNSTIPKDEGGGTTHLTVVDKHGNMVSMTTTIESSMGSAVVVPGRGFLLNNELTDFTDLGSDPLTGRPYPNRPEGGKKLRRTAVGDDALTFGGKRPRSSMSPIIVVDERAGKGAVLGLGSPGGTRIPGQNLNVLLNILKFNMLPQAATDIMARVVSRNEFAEAEDDIYNNNDTLEELIERGFQVEQRTFKEVQTVSVSHTDASASGLEMCGAADNLRKDVPLTIGIM